MKKQLNVDQIQSELRGGSAFFPGYKRADSPSPAPTAPEKAPKQEETRISFPIRVPDPVREPVPLPVPLIRKVKRPIRQRQPFDIYEDQYERLKKIAEQERNFINGRGMSQMVRDAIDAYLKDHDTSK